MADNTSSSSPQIGIIIPACDEAPAIAAVLEELLATIDHEKFVVSVGVNDSSDNTAEIARRYPVLVAETPARGYGHGCVAAIAKLDAVLPPVRAYIFFAADGASDPRDLRGLVSAFDAGNDFVLAARTRHQENWSAMTLPHVVANLVLAAWCGLLAGRWFSDLAPLRLIEAKLFHAIVPEELTFGWTIEAQIAAAKLGARMCEVRGRERARVAGEQKVSGVNWRRTFSIGCRIFAAGFRTRRRYAPGSERTRPLAQQTFIPHPQRGG